MIKDPKHETETPYELLGLSPDASPAEVHQALPRFMRDRRNIPRLGKAQEAVKKLKNARERAEVDIWFYEIENSGPSGEGAPLAIDEFRQVPCWPPESLDSDLESAGSPPELPEIVFMRPKIADSNRYDGWNAEAIRPTVDR